MVWKAILYITIGSAVLVAARHFVVFLYKKHFDVLELVYHIAVGYCFLESICRIFFKIHFALGIFLVCGALYFIRVEATSRRKEENVKLLMSILEENEIESDKKYEMCRKFDQKQG